MQVIETVAKTMKIVQLQHPSAQFLKAECFPRASRGQSESDLNECYVSYRIAKGTLTLGCYDDEIYPPIFNPPMLGFRPFHPLNSHVQHKSFTVALQEFKEKNPDGAFSDLMLAWMPYANALPAYIFRTPADHFVVVNYYIE